MVAPVTATVLAAAPERFAYADPVGLTASWRMTLLISAGMAVVGALLALGIQNGMPTGERTPEFTDAPHPGECPHCGVDGPPTHVRPLSRRPR